MIEILYGPIASGKSTCAKKRAKEGAIVINDDSIVNAVHGNQYTLYDKTLKPLYKGIELFIITSAVGMNRDVIIDRPCHKIRTWSRYKGIAESLDISFKIIIFTNLGPEIHAKRRFESDSRGNTYKSWLEVAQRHEQGFKTWNNEDFKQLLKPNEYQFIQ